MIVKRFYAFVFKDDEKYIKPGKLNIFKIQNINNRIIALCDMGGHDFVNDFVALQKKDFLKEIDNLNETFVEILDFITGNWYYTEYEDKEENTLSEFSWVKYVIIENGYVIEERKLKKIEDLRKEIENN